MGMKIDFQTTLNAPISLDGSEKMTLSSLTGLKPCGAMIINRVDGQGNITPSHAEVIYYDYFNGRDFLVTDRGMAGTTVQAHSAGSIVEGISSDPTIFGHTFNIPPRLMGSLMNSLKNLL